MSLDYSNRVLGSQKVSNFLTLTNNPFHSLPLLLIESNLQDNVKQMDREETQQKENMLFSSQEFAAKLQKAFLFTLILLNRGLPYFLLNRLLYLI